MLSRLTVHVDEELAKFVQFWNQSLSFYFTHCIRVFRIAFSSLQNMMIDLAHWRNEVLLGYVQFVQRDVSDAFSSLMETCSWRVILLLATWKQCELSAQQEKVCQPKEKTPSSSLSTYT